MNNNCLESWFWFGDDADLDCIVYSRLGLYRSLANELFPYRGNSQDLEANKERLVRAIQRARPEPTLTISFNDERDCLLALQELFDYPKLASLNPGQVAVIGRGGALYSINMQSHLNFSIIGSGTKPLRNVEDLINLDTDLDKELNWACSEELGFLNPEPAHVGSGMEFSALLFIPGIMASFMFDRVSKGLLAQGFEISVYKSGEPSERDDEERDSLFPFVQLRYTMLPGISETLGLSRIQQALDGLLQGERATRQRLAGSLSVEIEDKAYRAYAILAHAKLLSKAESRMLLSDLRTGLIYDKAPLQSSEVALRQCDTLWFASESMVRQTLESYPKETISENFVKSVRAKLVQTILTQYHIDGGK